jgi:hypothetical protein
LNFKKLLTKLKLRYHNYIFSSNYIEILIERLGFFFNKKFKNFDFEFKPRLLKLKSKSPDRSGEPGIKKGSFSWRKSATEGSYFFGLEKQLFE